MSCKTSKREQTVTINKSVIQEIIDDLKEGVEYIEKITDEDNEVSEMEFASEMSLDRVGGAIEALEKIVGE